MTGSKRSVGDELLAIASRTFRCGHPKVNGNIGNNGRWTRCLICTSRRNAEWRQKARRFDAAR
jgi:hypothetical protein